MDRKRIMGGVIVCLIAFFAALLTLPSAASAVESIKIGVIGPMKFVSGENTWNGAVLARDEINEAGGVSVKGVKRPIELVKADTNELRSVSDAVSAVEKIISVDKVDFVVGGFRSEAVLAMQDVAAEYKKIYLNHSASPEHTARIARDYNKYKYCFRGAGINGQGIGQVLFINLAEIAGIIRKAIGIERPKVAILVEKLLWAEPVVKAVEGHAPKMGMEVVGTWRPSAHATDVTAELRMIKASGAHIIFQGLTGPAGTVFARQWAELQNPTAIAGSSIKACHKDFWENTGGLANYIAANTGIARVKITEKTIPFWDKYLKRFGMWPAFESNTYESPYILKGAIERADTLEADAVIAELEKTDYLGPYGRVVYYPKDSKYPHDVKFGPGFKTWVYVQWQNGEMKCTWPRGWKGITYEGAVEYKLPPHMVEYWKKKQ